MNRDKWFDRKFHGAMRAFMAVSELARGLAKTPPWKQRLSRDLKKLTGGRGEQREFRWRDSLCKGPVV